MDYFYSFPAVRGIQACNEYYIAMVPLKMLKRLFPGDDEFVLPEYRAQRKLNEARIPEIKDYIINNRDSYVFSALAASIDGEFTFKPVYGNQIGILEINMDARFLINDGQHRKAAILAALDEDESLKDESISIVFYEDFGLDRSQQMFTDLNKHAVKTSNSLAELYDSRDPLAVSTRRCIARISFLNEYVDKEKDNLGKFSSSLFTLNTFYNANRKILGRGKCDNSFDEFIFKFWSDVVENMVPWNELVSKEISKRELRDQYVATQAVIIQALGRVGAYIIEHRVFLENGSIENLKNINWKRSSSDWKLRIIRNNGRMINNTKAIILAGNMLKKYLEIPLSEDEMRTEELFVGENRG